MYTDVDTIYLSLYHHTSAESELTLPRARQGGPPRVRDGPHRARRAAFARCLRGRGRRARRGAIAQHNGESDKPARLFDYRFVYNISRLRLSWEEHETNPGRSCGALRLNFRKRTKYREDAAQATTKVFSNLSRYDCRRIRD
jgi:hypothetical protein